MIASALLAGAAGVGVGAALSAFRPPHFTPRWMIIGLPVTASAVAAVLSSGSPTGWLAVDVLARAAVGAGIVFLGTACPPRLALASALAAVVAALGSSVQPLAAAAAGVLVVPALRADDAPFLTAVASGMLGQVVLRLSRPDTPGATALIAVVVVAPILVSGIASLGPTARRRLLRVSLAGAAFAIVGAGVGIGSALQAGDALRRGVRIVNIEVIPAGGDAQPATSGLVDARRDFRAARRTLDSWWARPAAAVPVVAQHWRALRAAAVSGEDLSDLGLRTATAFRLSGSRITDGQVPVDTLTGLQPALRVAVRDLSDARRRLTATRSDWLLPPVRKRLDDGRSRVAGAESGARTALRVLPELPALLGTDRPRRYFLAIQTPAELRATGGFIGNYGEITADDGQLRLTRFGSVVELQGGDLQSRRLLAPPDYVERYRRFLPQEEWGNVNLSPDFPTVAQVIAGLYPQSGGPLVDGVISIDPEGLAAILKVVGPVRVERWPTPITGDNVSDILLRDQYVRFDQRERERTEFQNEVTQRIWERLTTGSLPITRLLESLAPALRGKHLLLASMTPEEQTLFEDLRAAGAVKPPDRDFLGVVTQNAGASKLDVYLRREVDYRVSLDPGSGELEARLRVTLHNDAPASGLPTYVLGQANPPVPPGANKLYLSVYTPWRVAAARMDGKAASLETANELGRQVYSAFLVIPPRGKVVIELDLRGRLSRDGDYRLAVHRQPAARPDEIRTTVRVPLGWSVRNLPDTSATATWRLEADQTFRVPLRRQW